MQQFVVQHFTAVTFFPDLPLDAAHAFLLKNLRVGE